MDEFKKCIEAVEEHRLVVNQSAFYLSFFYKGWRPLLGWFSAFAVLLNFIVLPLVVIIMSIMGTAPDSIPKFDTSLLIPLITLVLGSIGVRTYEKKVLNAK